MSDLIDRQAAIDALADYIHNVDKVMGTGHLTADDCKDAAASVFEELPSVQTEVEKDTNVPINDCISKQAAIYAAERESQVDGAYGYMDTKSIVDMLNDLPSVQPEIMRCKDCKFFVSDMEWCEADDEHPASPDAFCSWAERRTDE